MRALQGRGRLRSDLDPQAVALMWTALLDGAAVLALVDRSLDSASVAARMSDVLWSGIAPRPTPRSMRDTRK